MSLLLSFSWRFKLSIRECPAADVKLAQIIGPKAAEVCTELVHRTLMKTIQVPFIELTECHTRDTGAH